MRSTLLACALLWGVNASWAMAQEKAVLAGCHYLLANAYQEAGEYDKAIMHLDGTLELSPKLASAYSLRGRCRGDQEQYDKAIADFTEAIRILKPERDDLLRSLDKKIPEYPKVLGIDSQLTRTYVNRAMAHNRNGQHGAAIEDCNEALEIDSKSIMAYATRAWAWNALNSYGKALVDYDKALRLDPKLEPVYNQRAWIRATCPDDKYRDGKQAVEDATQACELAKWENDNYLDTLAAAYAERGDFEEAVKWQKKMADKMPKDSGCQDRLKLYQSGKPYREPQPKS